MLDSRYAMLCLLGVLLLGVPARSQAQTLGCASPKGLDPVGFESITVSSTAIGLTVATINTVTAAAAYVTAEGAGLRTLFFGTPTATVGHLYDPPTGGNADMSKGAWLCGRATLLGFRAIRTGGTDATLRVSYFRQR